MSKNKIPVVEDEELATPPLRGEHDQRMNDTMPTGADALRLALAEQLEVVGGLLGGNTPNLYAIEAKKRLDEIGQDIDQFELVKDADMREKIYQEIIETLADTEQYIGVSAKIATDPVAQKAMGVRPLADHKRATLITPPDWENPDKPLH